MSCYEPTIPCRKSLTCEQIVRCDGFEHIDGVLSVLAVHPQQYNQHCAKAGRSQ